VPNNSNLHHRKSIRLKEYDYSEPGEYFVTMCTHNHECICGEIVNGEMRLNNAGKIVEECWKGISQHFNQVKLDEYIIMPNHIHGIIAICECNENSRGEVTSPLHKHTLGEIIAYFKYQSTKMINQIQGKPGRRIWQRNYYDRIIRNEKELNAIRDYIYNNTLTRAFDKDTPEEIPLFLK
jgi:REP element-mobilizing transposase RayT